MNDALRQAITAGRLAGSRYALTQPVRVPMGLIGTQVGQRAGSSVEFREHRDYQLGDDLRRIDWSVYARSDRLHVKLYREEVNPHADLLIDGSRSMDLPGTHKAQAAAALAAAIVTAAQNSGYTHNAYLAADGCKPVMNGNGDPERWEGLSFDHPAPLDASFSRLPPRFRTQSIRVLISDLLWPGDPMAVLQPLAMGAAMTVVVQVIARTDADPPQRGSLRLVDSETGERRDFFIDAMAQQRYRETLARHMDNWSRAATKVGAVMRTLIAEDVLKGWDLRPLVAAEVLKVH